MYRLPRALDPLPDESLPGLAMRDAQAYRFTRPERIFRRLRFGKLPLAMICQQAPAERKGQEMAYLLGLGDQQFRRLSLWHESRTLVNVLGHDVHHEMVRHRRRAVCPACLADSQHHRAIWLMDILPVCAAHGAWIMHACPGCKRPLSWQGAGVHRCRCGFDLRRAEPEIAASGAGPGILGLDAVFHGQAEAPLGLAFGNLLQVVVRLGLYALGQEGLINHSQRLAGFIRAHRTSLPDIMTAGWEALADWPGSFHACLAKVRTRHVPGELAGIERSFGGLHAWLFRWGRAGWGKPLAEEFARHVAGSPDVATTKHALSAYGSRQAIKRPDMSMREAQELLKLSAQTMQRIVERNPGMMLRETGPGVPSLLKGAEIQRLRRSNATLLTIKGVQTLLGIGRPVFLNLEAMGLVRPVPPTEYILENRAYRRADVQALLDRCLRGAVPIQPEEVAARKLLSLEEASRSWRTIYDIVGALSSGRLRAAAVGGARRGLRSVLLDPEEVEAALPHREALVTSSDLSAILKVKVGTLRAWRRAGFIRATEDDLHGRHAGVFFSPDAIQAFQAGYVSSADLALSEGRRPLAGLAIARDLMTVGVQPISGPGIDDAGTFLFRRSDLEGGILEHARDVRRKPDLATQREIGRQRVEGALASVTATWGGCPVRRRNTLTFPETGRVVHAVAGTRVSMAGRFTFHVDPVTHARLMEVADGWLAFVPSEGEHFLLVPFRDIVWPSHRDDAAGKVKWLSMRLQPTVEARWAGYCLALGATSPT